MTSVHPVAPASTASPAPTSFRRVIDATAASVSAVGGDVGLDRRGEHADTERFREDQILPGTQPGVGQDPIGMHLAGDRHAVLRLGVVDRVPADDREPGGGGDVLPAGEELAEQFGGELVAVPADEVQREQRTATHGVDVGHAVRRGDSTPGAGVVDDRGDEVGRGHQGPVRVDLPHGGIVAGVGTHEEFGGVIVLHVAHDVRQLARGELAASTGAVAELCEANPVAFAHVRTLPRAHPGGRRSGVGLTHSATRCRRPRRRWLGGASRNAALDSGAPVARSTSSSAVRRRP